MRLTDRIAKYLAVTLCVVIVLSLAVSVVSSTVGIVKWAKKKKAGPDTGVVTFTDAGDLRGICVEPGAGNLTVEEGEAFLLTYDEGFYEHSFKNHVLTVSPLDRGRAFTTERGLRLTLPRGLELDAFTLTGGAGNVSLGPVRAARVSLTCGNGSVEAAGLTAFESASIVCGGGETRLSDVYLKNLTLTSGAGGVSLHGTLVGANEIASGPGRVDLLLKGVNADFSFPVKKGAGEVRINGVPVETGLYGNGLVKVSLTGGEGALSVLVAE